MKKNRFKVRIYDKTNGTYIQHTDLFDIEKFESSDYEIEQCTGRRDCYGKLIFEGDVVKLCRYKNGKEYKAVYRGEEHCGIIRFGVYDSINLGFYIEWPEKIQGIFDEAFYWDENLKIVGNVHKSENLEDGYEQL